MTEQDDIHAGTLERLKEVERELDMARRRLAQLDGAYRAQQVQLDLALQRIQDMSSVVDTARSLS